MARKLKCSEGCGNAEYRMVNGEDETLCCGPSFKDQLFDLVTNNEVITFCERDRKDGVLTIEVVWRARSAAAQ